MPHYIEKQAFEGTLTEDQKESLRFKFKRSACIEIHRIMDLSIDKLPDGCGLKKEVCEVVPLEYYWCFTFNENWDDRLFVCYLGEIDEEFTELLYLIDRTIAGTNSKLVQSGRASFLDGTSYLPKINPR